MEGVLGLAEDRGGELPQEHDVAVMGDLQGGKSAPRLRVPERPVCARCPRALQVRQVLLAEEVPENAGGVELVSEFFLFDGHKDPVSAFPLATTLYIRGPSTGRWNVHRIESAPA